MSKEEPTFATKLKKRMTGAAMAAALATGPSTAPASGEYAESLTTEQPDTALPEPVLPPELSRYLEIGPERLRVELQVGEDTILIMGMDQKGDAKEHVQKIIEKALKHPERYDTLLLTISDTKEELPVCGSKIEIPQAHRTRDGLGQILQTITHEENLLRSIMTCSALLDYGPADESQSWTASPAKLEPVDPRLIVQKELGDSRLQLHGRVHDDQVPHRSV